MPQSSQERSGVYGCGVRLCVMIEGQEGVTWDDWLALARATEELGFDALFRSDHYGPVLAQDEPGSLDAWATLAALATVTSRIRLGTLVSPATFRHPSVLAKNAVTVDHISGGRVEVGLGASWNEGEHDRYGFPFPPLRERMDVFAEQLEIVHRQWAGERFSFEGEHYRLTDSDPRPKPVQTPHPNLIVGGSGRPRSVALAARWADEYNTLSTAPDECRALAERIADACAREGREPLRLSVMTRVPDGSPDDVVRQLAPLADGGVERVMLQHLDHRNLDVLRLIAEEVAPRLATQAR
jgi:F420-dependent oxidoreductase-like protein